MSINLQYIFILKTIHVMIIGGGFIYKLILITKKYEILQMIQIQIHTLVKVPHI